MAKKVKEEKAVEELEAEMNEELAEVEEIQAEPTSEEVIEALNEEIKILKNELLKQHADLENTRKRLEKERVLERKYAAYDFAKHLLTPIDSFNLALKHIDSDEKVQQFAKGIEMIKNQFETLLENEGVSEIAALNEEYDPRFHQAIMTEKIEGTESNKVIEVLQTGYMFKDRLIRPAIVKISE